MTRQEAKDRLCNLRKEEEYSLYYLTHQLLDEIYDDFEEQLSSNSLQLKGENENLHNAWVDCVERYESVLNKQIIKEKQTCEGCKYYVSINKSNTMVCSLSIDCIRKYVPKDRWESK